MPQRIMGVEISEKDNVVTEIKYFIDSVGVDGFVGGVVVGSDDEVLFVGHGLLDAYSDGFFLS